MFNLYIIFSQINLVTQQSTWYRGVTRSGRLQAQNQSDRGDYHDPVSRCPEHCSVIQLLWILVDCHTRPPIAKVQR
jgi:hypothetical protein